MTKKVVLIVAVVLLVLLGGWYFMTKKSPSGVVPGGSGTTQGSPVSSLKDLLTKGGAQSCTFSDANTSGSVYVSGGKVRSDFDVTTSGQVMKSHMIVMDNTSYIWTDGQKTGFKMAFDPNATPAATTGSETSTAPNGGFDATANNNYKCSTWVVDSSKFTLPSGVNFTSFSVPTVPQQGTTTGSSSSSQCSYCDSLTGTDKTQCLTALKCN